MKTIFLVRHADAYAADDKMNDYDRPLSSKGEKSAKKMAKKLKKALVLPLMVFKRLIASE